MTLASIMSSSQTVNAQDAIFPANQWGKVNLRVTEAMGGEFEAIIANNNNMERLASYPLTSRLRKISATVGRLDIRFARTKEFATCTATIVGPDILLTAAHCVPNLPSTLVSKGEIDAVTFVTNHYRESSIEDVDFLEVDTTPIWHNSDLDAALLRVHGNPGKEHGIAKLDASQPSHGSGLLLVHHPGGLPKHVTRGNCKEAGTSGATLLHVCDTVKGSSGAPIFSDDTGAVVGIHSAGSPIISRNSVNFGVLIGSILRAYQGGNEDTLPRNGIFEFNVTSAESLDDVAIESLTENSRISTEPNSSILTFWEMKQSCPSCLLIISKTQATEVQRLLLQIGRSTGVVDGIWGPNSAYVLAGFQRSVGLRETGLFDYETISKLKSEHKQVQKQNEPPKAWFGSDGHEPDLSLAGFSTIGTWVFVGQFNRGSSDWDILTIENHVKNAPAIISSMLGGRSVPQSEVKINYRIMFGRCYSTNVDLPLFPLPMAFRGAQDGLRNEGEDVRAVRQAGSTVSFGDFNVFESERGLVEVWGHLGATEFWDAQICM